MSRGAARRISSLDTKDSKWLTFQTHKHPPEIVADKNLERTV